MKIIAVNISKTKNNNTLLQATERAWKLNIKRAGKYAYIIGVSKNIVHSYFKISNINVDNIHPNRINFDLVICSMVEQNNIDNYISSNGILLERFTTKYID